MVLIAPTQVKGLTLEPAKVLQVLLLLEEAIVSKINRIPDDQALALYAWQKRHGRYWRANLRNAWANGRYGRIDDDQQAALQRLRNTDAMLINDLTQADLRVRVHHIQVLRTAQALLDKLNAGQGHVYTTERVALEGLLQEAPASYDRDL